MTNRRTPLLHTSSTPRPRARTAPVLAACALATACLAAATLTKDHPTTAPSIDAGAPASAAALDPAQVDAADAQAFADRFARAFARYLTHPEQTGPLVRAGAPRSQLTGRPPSRPSSASNRAGTGTSKQTRAGSRADRFVARSVAARPTRTGWLLSAALTSGTGPDRVVVPLVAAARRNGTRFRVTSLNARAGAE